jgi:MEMO1 family protein
MASAPSLVRPPAVAGSFYPGSPEALRAAVEGLLAGASPPAGRPPKAVIAPHAGYVYSGPIAANAFTALLGGAEAARRERPAITKIVLLGPAHRVWVRGLALPAAEAFATPLGEVPVDPEGAQAVLRLPQVTVQPEAHAPEHSLEVELPFLQVLLGDGFEVLPLVVGEADAAEVAEVLEAVWGGAETAVVISSDLSHYLPYETAQRVDEETAQEILRLGGPIHPQRACGAYPVSGLLVAARRRGMAAELLDLRNSGDTAGDRRQVVGYGAFAFHERA